MFVCSILLLRHEIALEPNDDVLEIKFIINGIGLMYLAKEQSGLSGWITNS